MREKVLTKCRKCGVMHGMGIWDREKDTHTPIDLYYDCLWKNNMVYEAPPQVIIKQLCDSCKKGIDECPPGQGHRILICQKCDMESVINYCHSKMQDQLIRDVINSSASPLVSNDPTCPEPLDPPCEPIQ